MFKYYWIVVKVNLCPVVTWQQPLCQTPLVHTTVEVSISTFPACVNRIKAGATLRPPVRGLSELLYESDPDRNPSLDKKSWHRHSRKIQSRCVCFSAFMSKCRSPSGELLINRTKIKKKCFKWSSEVFCCQLRIKTFIIFGESWRNLIVEGVLQSKPNLLVHSFTLKCFYHKQTLLPNKTCSEKFFVFLLRRKSLIWQSQDGQSKLSICLNLVKVVLIRWIQPVMFSWILSV